MIKACLDNLDEETPKHNFTVGINDDVTHTSLKVGEEFDTVNIFLQKFLHLFKKFN